MRELLRCPKLIQVLCARRRHSQLGPHLKPVRLHEVQRPEHAIDARQDAQVVLAVLNLLAGEAVDVKPFEGGAIKSKRGLFELRSVRLRLGCVFAPLLKPDWVSRVRYDCKHPPPKKSHSESTERSQ